MLQTLRIQNLAIIHELELEFSSGFNVITGETGAGKSIILRGLQLLTGARSSGDIVRAGSDRCEVEALFFLSNRERRLLEAEDDFKEFLEGDEILLRRTVDLSGRSKAYVNGRLSTLGRLSWLSASLFDMTGQHQHQSLLIPEEHMKFLDLFAAHGELLESVQKAYREYAELRRKLERLREERSTRDERIRSLSLQVEELEELALKPGEHQSIEEELERLSHMEELVSLMSVADATVQQDEDSVLSRIKLLVDSLRQAQRYDPGLGEVLSLIEEARVNLNEAALSISEYQDKLEIDPARLESLRARFSELRRAERRWNLSTDELVEREKALRADLDELSAGDGLIKQVEAELEEKHRVLSPLIERLSKSRRAAAKKLGTHIETQLKLVNMKNARFKVEVSSGTLSAFGHDAVRFLLASNPGQPYQSLEAVASGGELSRVLLVLKASVNKQSGATLQIFDEIDSGIGGNVAYVVGEKLKGLTENAQVLAVTHAPQIAALADNHLLIQKAVEGEETYVRVVALVEEKRVTEIARMLSGKKVSGNFLDSARELLRN